MVWQGHLVPSDRGDRVEPCFEPDGAGTSSDGLVRPTDAFLPMLATPKSAQVLETGRFAQIQSGDGLMPLFSAVQQDGAPSCASLQRWSPPPVQRPGPSVRCSSQTE